MSKRRTTLKLRMQAKIQRLEGIASQLSNTESKLTSALHRLAHEETYLARVLTDAAAVAAVIRDSDTPAQRIARNKLRATLERRGWHALGVVAGEGDTTFWEEKP